MTSEREILNLLYEYCWLVDQGRYEEIGELFAEADIYFGETLAYSHDKAAFAGMFAGSNISYAPDDTPRTIHMCIDPSSWSMRPPRYCQGQALHRRCSGYTRRDEAPGDRDGREVRHLQARRGRQVEVCLPCDGQPLRR